MYLGTQNVHLNPLIEEMVFFTLFSIIIYSSAYIFIQQAQALLVVTPKSKRLNPEPENKNDSLALIGKPLPDEPA
jgi:hypothetical protein